MKAQWLKIGMVVLFLTAGLSGCLEILQNEIKNSGQWNGRDSQEPVNNNIIFIVTVPENTQDEDIVYLCTFGGGEFRMDKIGP